MNKIEFDRGTKRKCGSCGTLFYDFDKNPINCPACGADVSLLTNITKRGRPPKILKVDEKIDKKTEIDVDELNVDIDSGSDDLIIEEEIEEGPEDVEGIIDIPNNESQ